MRIPKEVGRLFKPFDWWGWIMSIIGLLLLCRFGGVGWIFGTDTNWWLFAATFFVFAEFAIRVGYGRVYKIVYYDTILHNMYEIEAGDKTFFVCALNEEELDLYMELHYPNMKFKVINETHTESFIKTEEYQ
jgi:hypothetical protein